MAAQLHRIGNNLFSKAAVTIEISANSEIDFSKVCRTCLRESEDNDLENEALYILGCNGKLARLYEVFEIATGLKIATGDMLPRHICNSCLQSVKSSFSFHCQSQRANEILESVLLSMKDENPSTSTVIENLPKIEEVQEGENEEAVEEDEEGEEPTFDENSEETPEDTQVQHGEEVPVEFAEEKSEPEEQEQTEILNFEFTVDGSLLSPIEDILQDDDNNEMMMMEIEPLSSSSEQDENSEHDVPIKNGNRDFRCDFCHSMFNLQRDLIQHYKDEHPDEKPFKCDICSASFVHIQSMRRHKNTHAAGPKQKACPLCNWSFTRSDDLTRHMRTHTDERPYACSVCQKAFKQHTELKDHMLSHDDRKMYNCVPCNKEWRSRNGWYLHMRAHQDGRNGRRLQRVRKFE